MLRHSALALLCGSLALAACQTGQWGSDQTGGAAPGALPGAQFGRSRPAETGPGILLAGWAGNEVGTAMDETDRRENQQAERRAYTAPIGQQITWNDPQNGNAGTITPTRDGYAGNGAYCREFRQTVTIGGKQQQGYGKACQQQDGSWKIVQ